MRKITRLIYFMSIAIFAILGTYSNTYADSSKGKPIDKVYTNCGIPTPYKGVKFYDCQIPYSITYKELGGIDVNMPDSTKTSKVGTAFIRESCHNSRLSNGNLVLGNCKMGAKHLPDGVSVKDEGDYCIATDKLGQKYYIAAIGQWCRKATKSEEDKGYKVQGAQLFDVILTDGTIIHCVEGDNFGWGHSVGCENTGQDNVNYTRTEMKYPQYKGMCHANGGQLLELWQPIGKAANLFNKKYNISSANKDNKIAYMRMYNKNIGQATNRGHKALSCKSDGSFSEDSDGGGSGMSTGGKFMVSEWELEGMPSKSKLTGNQSDIELADRSGLGLAEVYTVDKIGDDITMKNKALTFDKARILISFIGLVLIMYSVLMFVAMIFDKANTFIEFSMVSFLTLGKLKYSAYENDSRINKKGSSNTSKLLISTVVILIVGMVIVSGAIWNGMSNIVYEFSQKFL